jgi:hypothetical protein
MLALGASAAPADLWAFRRWDLPASESGPIAPSSASHSHSPRHGRDRRREAGLTDLTGI